MHIAVLDDDVASRKQMERLLERASDENKKNGREGYYIDSYGSFEPLISKLSMYDAIFIDMVNSEKKGHELAVHFYDNGIAGKIILCTSTIDYHDKLFPDYVEQFEFINKPIKTEELKTILIECEQLKANKVPKLEIRTEEETLYVNYEEFIFAKALVPGKTSIVLKGGKELLCYYDISLVKSSMSPYPFIVVVNPDTVVSSYHIKNVKKYSVEMDEGSTFKIPFKLSKNIHKDIDKAPKYP